jgi:hypothetical protein
MTRRAVLAQHKGHDHKGPMVEKRRWNGPEYNNGRSNRGLKQQLHLGSKEIFYETLRQTIEMKVMMGTVRASMRIQKMGGKTLCRVGPL